MTQLLKLEDARDSTTFRSATRPVTSAGQKLAEGLYWLLKNEGFHSGKDPILNDRLSQEFARRMDAFIVNEGLTQPESIILPKQILMVFFGTKHGERRPRPHARDVRITLEEINHLALLSGLYLLKLGFVGMNPETGLMALKTELVWLLRKRGYSTQDDRIVLCPLQTDWGEYEALWLYVANYHAQDAIYKTPPERLDFNPEICSTCPVACRIPQK